MKILRNTETLYTVVQKCGQACALDQRGRSAQARPMANDDDEGPDHHGTYLHFQEHGML